MLRTFIPLMATVFFTSCAASIGSPEINFGEEQNFKRTAFAAAGSTGVAPFKAGGRVNGKSEWFACENVGAAQTVVVINGDNHVFDGQFCRDWEAQTFLSAGFSVIGVNRPGFGKSEPEHDFSGPVSINAIDAAMKAVDAKHKWFAGTPVGVWGFQSGAIAAAFFAKGRSGMQWMMLGNGIFDLEEFRSNTKSKAYQQMIAEAQGKGSADEFNEARSIAWGTTGLPKRILLYHGEADTVIYPNHSASFRDILAAEEYSVKLELIPETGHDLNPTRHRLVVEAMLNQLVPKP